VVQAAPTGLERHQSRAVRTALLDAGVFYGATASENTAFAGEHVFIAGGANSAGQAAVNLARYAQQVTIVVRGDSLAARMSQYMIDEITATANIDVRTTSQITAAEGTGKLDALTLTDTKSGSTETVASLRPGIARRWSGWPGRLTRGFGGRQQPATSRTRSPTRRMRRAHVHRCAK
jgi:thioredoxin reductase